MTWTIQPGGFTRLWVMVELSYLLFTGLCYASKVITISTLTMYLWLGLRICCRVSWRRLCPTPLTVVSSLVYFIESVLLMCRCLFVRTIYWCAILLVPPMGVLVPVQHIGGGWCLNASGNLRFVPSEGITFQYISWAILSHFLREIVRG